MSKKSVFAQLDACAVPPHDLMPSPRHWNPGLLRYRDRLWLAYRYHREETNDARCGVAICEIDENGTPLGASQMLRFNSPRNCEHHEDCRLFMFRGEPMIAWTMMQGYRPGVDYTCCIKYAQLKLKGSRWSVVEEWHPVYGKNNGFSKEKNWIFFERDDELYFIYGMDPEHVVCRIEGSKVVEEYRTPGAQWLWGHQRGGTPPVDLGDGRMMSIFHSSIPTETPPHYVRYYAAAYTFEDCAPFRVLQISEQPILAGSEEDGHRVDPRYTEGWKPYVVFPCGLIEDKNGWLASLGINDWQCAVARISAEQLKLGAADGASFKPRFFTIQNGTVPVRYVDAHQKPIFKHWQIVKARRGCLAGAGYIKAESAREAVEISEFKGAVEITEADYQKALRNRDMVLW